jgi:hypothetical protein
MVAIVAGEDHGAAGLGGHAVAISCFVLIPVYFCRMGSFAGAAAT